MTKSAFLKAGALGALATALLASALPAQAQTWSRGGGHGHNAGARGQVREDRAHSPRQSRPAASARSDWGGGHDQAREAARSQAYAQQSSQQAAAPQAQTETRVAAPARNASYAAPRDRSYGAYTRSGSQGDRQAQWAAQNQRSAASGQYYGRSSEGRGDRSTRYEGQRGRQDARREEYREDRHNYREGYRDGRRADNRYGNDYRRWDNRAWRNDNRYDWYRYRASNHSLFRLGRYYSPYRGYNYSRISIGFRLGSLFYSNRYWINDPWQYRLPDVYGPYRWIRYYNDALLVDIYSGEVVDVINNFFW